MSVKATVSLRAARPEKLLPLLGLLVISLLTPSLAEAGIYYRAVTEIDSGVGSNTVDAWVEGDNARIEFTASDLPMAEKGTYLVTRDAGKTLFLVNPKEKTFARWDLEAMLSTVGQMMDSMGGMVQMEITDPVVEVVGEEDGGTLVGLATRKHSYRTANDLKVKVLGMKRRSKIETEQQIWATEELDLPAMSVWLRSAQPTGNENFDKLIATEFKKVDGLPVKTETVTTTRDKKGRTNTTRSVMTVTELRQDEQIANERFDIPAGFEEVAMPLMGGANDNEDGSANPLSGLFGRRGGGR